jgi:hypothetical protein
VIRWSRGEKGRPRLLIPLVTTEVVGSLQMHGGRACQTNDCNCPCIRCLGAVVDHKETNVCADSVSADNLAGSLGLKLVMFTI